MAPITTTIEIDWPRRRAIRLRDRPVAFSEWQKGVVDGSMDTPGAAKVSDRFLTTRRIGLAIRSGAAEVVHIDPLSIWGVRALGGSIRAAPRCCGRSTLGHPGAPRDLHRLQGHGIGRLLVPLIVEREARKEMP